MIPTTSELSTLVAEPARLGAAALEVLVEEARGHTLTADPGRPIARHPEASSRLTVRAFTDDGRVGWAEGPTDGFDQVVAAALRDAATAAPTPDAGPQRRAEPTPRGLGIDDPRHDQITDEDRHEILHTAARALSRSGGRPGRFSYTELRQTRRLATSTGLALETRATTYTTGGSVTLEVPGGPLTLQERAAGRSFSSTACLPLGTNLAQRAQALLGEVGTVEGPVRVLLPPRATAPLVDWLARQLATGDTSAFLDEAREEPLLSRKLHLVDDPSAPGGLRTLPFDDRGTVPHPLTLVAEGRVVGRYLDLEAARARTTRPSGHAHDHALRPSNLMLNGGTRSMNAWLGEQTVPVLEVDAIDDLDRQNPRSGLLDLRVNGLLRQGHRVLHAVHGLRLRGDLRVLLADVVAVTSDTDRLLHVDAPGLLLDGFTAG